MREFKLCKNHIRPLFKSCKSGILHDAIDSGLMQIITSCEEGDYVSASNSYFRLAIGNAAWPMGITMVGIHERKGREKIASANVAHIMNNERQRKYLTAVKTLMKFHQNKSENVDYSRKVL